MSGFEQRPLDEQPSRLSKEEFLKASTKERTETHMTDRVRELSDQAVDDEIASLEMTLTRLKAERQKRYDRDCLAEGVESYLSALGAKVPYRNSDKEALEQLGRYFLNGELVWKD